MGVIKTKRMKSVKEKAEEKYPIITGELQTYNEKFVEGANYVLECIEESIKNAPAGYGLIYHIIEQLKE